jgi:16S rRNA (cytosine1402-N4)-methyltransferase
MTKPIKKEEYTHESVLLNEVCEYLSLPNKRNIVDATLGLGGHAKAILEIMPKSGKIIGFDADPEHIKLAKKELKSFKDRVVYIKSNFADMAEELKKIRVRVVDAFLFDLGIASPHVDNPERGFSFLREGDLDMRFDPESNLTAAEVVNKYSEKELARIFKEYGEERQSQKIAQAICKTRKRNPFKTTLQLADFVEKHIKRIGRIHPATRIFQALRIEVNKELDVLVEGLKQAVELLKKEGRVAVISYHSLEDRVVKNFFRDLARAEKPVLKIVTKKPIVPSAKEIANNPRSRSAKLRVVEKL